MCTTHAANTHGETDTNGTITGSGGDLCCRTTIDMVTPQVAGETLRLDNAALLEVVNRGLLPAYELGGVIRFRVSDVEAVAAEFASA